MRLLRGLRRTRAWAEYTGNQSVRFYKGSTPSQHRLLAGHTRDVISKMANPDRLIETFEPAEA